ncbi:MAG: hypothetical protein COS84_05360 [Armatimonadetes bacterium CG07_land_8_20_14_0_80_40_9]|nr:MAG: hypothetical protein COS84_05360 [Armatimonadetes bacterium CG07_land_8_20_14_0_80_40_9]
MSVIAKRYAQGLFAVAKENNLLEDVKLELGRTSSELAKNKDLIKVLTHPKIRLSEKRTILNKLLGDGVSRVSQSFFNLLLEKKRLGIIFFISSEFSSLLDTYQGVIRAEAKTAVPLKEEEKVKLKEELEKRLSKKTLLKTVVDKELLGGVWIKTGDRVIDGSVKGYLKRLREELI